MRFREILQAELARRCAKNERYSLRAFARALGIDHSTLSQIIRGRRSASPAAIRRLGPKLGLSAERIEVLASQERSRASDPEERALLDASRVLTERHHLAILELARLGDFRPDSRWLGRVLGLSTDTVNVAIARLARLHLIELAGSTWRVVDTGAVVSTVLRHASLEPGSPAPPVAAQEEEKSMESPVMQFQILSKAPEGVAAFYSRAFGWRVRQDNALGYRAVETGSSKGIGGGIWPAPPEGHSAVQLMVEMSDVAGGVARVQAAGGRVIMPPQVLPDGDTLAIVADPEGLTIGLFRPRPTA
ncbi:MAG TPA: VOC family protein [Myxococcaceae bacterium]|nr:VOC family protein [Myxococcaceae bacterium]